ncbi:MAG: FkbM family methyltransferase [Chitinophagaceae bacterium]
MKKTSDSVKLLVKFIQRFGFFSGTKLFFQVRRGKLSRVKVPGIKFPIRLRKGTSDVPAFYQVFLNKEYDVAFSKEPAVIIDGGANIGLFTILMKNRYPSAKVVCIEPDPDNFGILQENVSRYENTWCENCGIWNADTRLRVYDKFNAGKWGMVVEDDPANGTINAISIESLLKKYNIEHIDILKLDIETSEKYVFEKNFESWLQKTGIIIIELHDWLEPGCAKPFFSAINKSFDSYKFLMKGENVMVEKL